MISGIYKITNKINNKVYIGQSVNIEERWDYHKAVCHWDNQSALYRAFKKYGIKNFDFQVIEKVPPIKEQLNEREIYWIKYYDACKNGYNLTKGGNSFSLRYTVVTPQQVIDIRTRKLNFESPKKVYEDYQNLISWATFNKIWNGALHADVMPEVYQDTEKLKMIERILKQRMNLEKSPLTIDIILDIRQCKINGLKRAEILKKYPHISSNTIDGIWYNKYYKEITPNNTEYVKLLKGES